MFGTNATHKSVCFTFLLLHFGLFESCIIICVDDQAIDRKDWPGEGPLNAEVDLWDDCRLEVCNSV